MGYGEASGVKAYKLFDLDTRKFFFSRSVTFDEATLMEKHQHEVHQSTPNLKTNELIITGDSQIDNYGGPTTRGRSFMHLQLDHQQHANTPKKEKGNDVTYYFNEIPTQCVPHLYEENNKADRDKSTVDSHLTESSNKGPNDNTSENEGCYNNKIGGECSPQPFSHQEGYWFPKNPASTNDDMEKHDTNVTREDATSQISLESKNSSNPSSVNRNPPSISTFKASRLLKTTKQKYRSIKDIMADTEPFDALMVDLGEEEDSVSIKPQGEHNQVMPGDDVTLTSHEALNSEFKREWHQAMKEELGSLMKNNTWELVSRPKNRKVVSCKWVLRVKSDSNGNPIRFKARVVARGFTQVPGLDFKETFAPTLRTTPMRLVWGLTTALNLELRHLDVETAFLHGDLEEEIYMEQPPHFKDVEHPNFVCKLKKAIYGLKQSSRMWYTKLHSYLVKIKFKRLSSEPNLYIRKDGQTFIILGVYVDFLAIASNNIEALRHAIHQLQQVFPVKDLGPMEYCLGIKVTRNRTEGTLSISKKKLIDDILRKYEMQECKPISTPMTVPCKLSIDDSPSTQTEVQFMETIPYRQILGSIRYLVSCTRPDLSFSAGYLSRFMQNPGVKHWEALKRVMRYLQYTKDMTITYKSFQSWNTSSLEGWHTSPLQGWTDSDWGGDVDSSRSTSGMVFMFAGGAISWRTKKQTTVALSSTEAEYVAAALAAKEGLWLKSILKELDVIQLSHMKMYCDNQSCIKIAINPKLTDQNKHIKAKHHFLRDLVEMKELELHYTSTTTMWADFLTKPVSQQKHWQCCSKLGLKLIHK